MFWKKKELIYDVLVPPIIKEPKEFTEKEAKMYFDWYINQIPKRIEYISKTSGCKTDMSFESLINIWGWFLKIAEVEETPLAKINLIKKELNNKPKEYVEYVISQSKEQFSLQTEYILRDIGMYVGEIFVNYNPKIIWGYHTDVDKDSFVNIPLLKGFIDYGVNPPFSMYFEPVHMVGVQAANLFDNTQDRKDLYELCQHWLTFIPK